MSLSMSKDDLLKIKSALEFNLPNSLQLYSIVQQILTEDGIEREVKTFRIGSEFKLFL